jgi:hypothetical protein
MLKINKVVLYFKSLEVWIRAFWSVALVIVAGRLFFYEEIVNSIESTPHPSLVYTIFGTAALSVLIFAYTLYRYVAEANLMVRMHGCTPQERMQILDKLRWTPDLMPVYRLLINLSNGATHIRADAFENELVACEGKVLSRLTLADYLGGALVGLGLVGTFVGLLGTLNDLGKIFESLISVGAKDVDPVAMFGNMIAKLQDPMKGMSTAFVASLYGLMGSLVIGLVALSLRHTGVSLCKSARELLKADLYGDGIPDDVVPTGDPAVSPAIASALKAIPVGIDAVLGVQKNLLAQNKQLLEEHRAWFDRHRAFDVRLAEVLRSMTVQSDLHIKHLDAYQKLSSPKRWILPVVVSIVTSVVSAVVMILIYVRLGDGQSLKNIDHTKVPLVTNPAPSVGMSSASMPKVDIQPVLSVITVEPAASASGVLASKIIEPEQVQVEKPAEQLAPVAPAPTSKKQKSKSDMVSANKKNKDKDREKAKAKINADALKSEEDPAVKCELDPARCVGAAVSYKPAIKNTDSAASSEEAK